MVEDASELTLRFFRDLGKKFNPDRVLIELNGMWEIGDFLEGKLPPEWPLYQIVTTVNAQTFELYSNNIGPRMFEQISMADLIVFNRCTDELKQMLYKKNIRAMKSATSSRASCRLSGRSTRSSPRSTPRPSSCTPTTSARVCSSRFPWPI